MRRPGWVTRLWGRLLGFREVERTERSVVLRLPWWAKGRALDGVEEKLRADARVAWPGDELVMSRGDRLLRLEPGVAGDDASHRRDGRRCPPDGLR